MDSVGLRFFSAGVDLSAAAKWAAQVDYRDRLGLLALTGADHRIVGHAVYERTGADRAEVAFEVADTVQGQGLGTILLAHLAEAAEEQGVSVFEAEVLPQNHRMIGVFRESGFGVRMRSKPDLVVVEIPTALSPDAIRALRGAREELGCCGTGSFPEAAFRGRDRRRPEARNRRRRNLPQPALPCLQRPRPSGQPERGGGPVGDGLRVGRASAWRRRARRDLRPRALRGRHRPPVCAEGCARAARDLGRIRRDRR